jgi:Pyruvate/2-oxoacid:ferredoxin oxidoreductase gamma subunit
VSLESVVSAIRGRFRGDVGERNAAAAEEAYSLTSSTTREAARA